MSKKLIEELIQEVGVYGVQCSMSQNLAPSTKLSGIFNHLREYAQRNVATQAPCYSEGDQQATAHKARATPAVSAGEEKVDADYRVPTQPVVAAPSPQPKGS